MVFDVLLSVLNRYANRMVAVLVGSVLALFLIYWLQRPLYWIFWPDSWGYYEPALSAISGGPFNQIYGRTFVYPLFVYLVLAMHQSFAAVIYAQLGLFFVTLGCFTLAWATFAPPRQAGGRYWMHRLLGMLLLSVLLYYQPLQLFVHTAMPEMLYATLAMAQMWLVLIIWLRPLALSWLIGMLVISSLLAVATYLIKPHWGVAMLVLLALLLLRLLREPKLGTWPKIALPITIGCLAYMTLLAPQRYLAQTYDPYVSRVFGPLTMFCNHTNLVVRLIEQPGYLTVHPEQALLQRMNAPLRAILAQGPVEGWNLLGFNGDKCTYNNELSTWVKDRFSGDPVKIARFYRDVFIDAVLASPGAYLSKIFKQILAVLKRPMLKRNGVTPFDEHVFEEKKGRLPAYDRAARASVMTRGEFTAVFHTGNMPLSWLLRRLLRLLSKGVWMIWSITGVVLLWDLYWVRFHLSLVYERAAPCLLSSTMYLSALVVVAMAHTFDVSRYFTILAPLCLLSVGTSVFYLTEYTLSMVQRKRRRNE